MQRKDKSLSKRLNLITTATILLGVLSGCIYISGSRFGQLVRLACPGWTDITGIHNFLFQFVLLNIIYFIALYLVFKKIERFAPSRLLLPVLFLFGILFRLCLIPTTPVLSSDAYRYVWDGRVQARGINPYLHPPASESLSALRDKAIYPHINRRDFPTVYPAGAQIFFIVAYKIAGDSLYRLKGVIVFFDVLTMVVLIALLRTYGLHETRFIVYAWNPLAIFEIAGNGHLEGFAVFLVVLAFFLYATDRRTLGVVSLAYASCTKIYPALLLPVLIDRGERMKRLLIFFSCILVLYLPYFSAEKKILGFLPIYLKSPYESFNVGLRYLLMGMLPGLDYDLLTKLLVLILFSVAIVFFFRHKGREEVLKYTYILISLQLILMPVALHPWYMLWLLPFLAFYPVPAWLLFSCTVGFSYLKYVSPKGIMPHWVLYLEFIPLIILLLVDSFWRQQTPGGWFPWRAKGSTAF